VNDSIIVERPRRIEIPKRGRDICAALDRCDYLKSRQTGDHRTYLDERDGERFTVLNTRNDLEDSNPKVWHRLRKKLIGKYGEIFEAR